MSNSGYTFDCNSYSSLHPQGPRIAQRSGFSCQSAGPDMAQFHRISVGGGGIGVGGGGGGCSSSFYREDMRMGGYQGGARPQSTMEPWMVDGSDAVSMVSDRDATFGHQYAQSHNGFSSQMRQGGGTMTFPGPMRRSLSGTLSRSGGMTGGEVEMAQQHSYKGPAHRTISRITNRNRMSMGSMQMSSGGSTYGGGVDRVDRGFIASGVSSGSQGNLMQRTLPRTMSIKSMQSVGKGMDIFGGQTELGVSMGNLSG